MRELVKERTLDFADGRGLWFELLHPQSRPQESHPGSGWACSSGTVRLTIIRKIVLRLTPDYLTNWPTRPSGSVRLATVCVHTNF